MTSDKPLRVRVATETDAALLLAWRNDEHTRSASRATEPVSWDEHVRWLRASLSRDDRQLLVVECDTPIGTVRWDRLDAESWELSITIAPDARSKGLGLQVLGAGERALRATTPVTRLVAVTRVDNVAAQRLFSAAGYVPSGPARGGLLTMEKTLSA